MALELKNLTFEDLRLICNLFRFVFKRQNLFDIQWILWMLSIIYFTSEFIIEH